MPHFQTPPHSQTTPLPLGSARLLWLRRPVRPILPYPGTRRPHHLRLEILDSIRPAVPHRIRDLLSHNYRSALLPSHYHTLYLPTPLKISHRRQKRNSLSQTLSTPSCPCVPLAYKNGRPNPTAFAPSANALTTSAPDLTPPSIMMSTLEKRSGRRERISYKMSMGAGALAIS